MLLTKREEYLQASLECSKRMRNAEANGDSEAVKKWRAKGLYYARLAADEGVAEIMGRHNVRGA